MDEKQRAPRWQPTAVPESVWQSCANRQWVQVETPEEAEAEAQAFRTFMQPGQRVPLLWEDGVTTLVVKSVGKDGTIEVCAATD